MLLLKKSKDIQYTPLLQPERILLSKEITSIGRARDLVDVVVDSSLCPLMISRVHAKMSRKDHRFEIECNSLNGILVNNIKRKKCELQNGDTVVFGGAGTKTTEGSFVANPSSELVYVFICNQKILNTEHSNSNDLSLSSAISSKDESTHKETSKVSLMGETQSSSAFTKRADLKNIRPSQSGISYSSSPDEETSDQVVEKNRVIVNNCGGIKSMNLYSSQMVSQEDGLVFTSAVSNDSLGEGTSDGLVKKRMRINEKGKGIKLTETDKCHDDAMSEDDGVLFKRKNKRSRMPFDSDEESPSPTRKLLKKDGSKETKGEREQHLQSEINKNKVFLKDLNEELLCCICQELLILTHALSCSHTFCYVCIRNWLREAADCPSCRSRASFNTLVPVKVLDSMVEKVARRVLSADELEERKIKIQELQARIHGRMEDHDELRAEYGCVSSNKQYCEKCNLVISNRLLRWVICFPKTLSTASYHFKCFKPPSHIDISQVNIAPGISKTDMIKIKTVVKK